MKRKRIIFLGSIFIVLLIVIIYIPTNKELEEINEGMIGIYIEDENAESGYSQSKVVPEGSYQLNSEKSYCKYNEEVTSSKISYDMETKKMTISPIPEREAKCYLYFDVVNSKTIQEIIAQKDIQTRTDFSTTLESDTTGIMYQAEDDDGTTYYFAGAPTDNYVYFAGFYWRIVRVNGDGSIRLIYAGTTAGATGSGAQVSDSKFNNSTINVAYVGFMYTSGSVHGLETSSTIKSVLDSWYKNNLTEYEGYIDTNAGFCGDRTSYADEDGTIQSDEESDMYYGAYIRLITNNAPSYKCMYSEDLYTTSTSNKGNKALTYPIGLISADEVVYAGDVVVGTSNNSFYLYTGSNYWTMTPYYIYGTEAYVFRIGMSGSLDKDYVNDTWGVRPVINLKANTTFEGDGTIISPYIVKNS